jgi:iron complex transport system substrate-binding protein
MNFKMKLTHRFYTGLVIFASFILLGCNEVKVEEKTGINKETIDGSRIVSLNGTISEILVELGMEKNIVGVDVTSNYPASIQKLPKAGHNRVINTEAVLAMNPTVIFVVENGIKPEAAQQFKTANVRVVFFKHDYSVDGAKNLVEAVADTLGLQNKVPAIIQKMDAELAAVSNHNSKPRVLFIYARGAGSMSVCGNNTAIAKMISLAGGENAAADLEDFKPYSSESLVERNPDVLLFFDSGLESLNGIDGLLAMPGVGHTNAGKNKKIETMDGQLLSGFGPRIGLAVAQLSKLIHE